MTLEETLRRIVYNLRLTAAILGIWFASWALPARHPAQERLRDALLALG